MIARTTTLLLSLALLGTVAGCQKPTDDPVRAFQLFVDRVQAGDTDGAWELLSAESREQLDDLVKRRAAASEGAIPADPKEALFGSATLARPIEAVEVVKSDGRRALLKVSHPGGESQDVVMVHEEGGWRLSLEAPPGS